MIPRSLGILLLLLVIAPAQGQPASGPDAPRIPLPRLHRESAQALEAAIRERLGEPQADLDLDLITMGEDYFGAEPERVRWSPDGSRIWFWWKRWDQRRKSWWSFDVAAGALDALPEGQEPPAAGVWSADRGRRAWSAGEALFVQDSGSPEVRQALLWSGGIQDLVLSPEGAFAHFRSGGGLYRLALDSPGLTQLLALRKDPLAEPEEQQPGDLEAWHEARERAISRVLEERETERERSRDGRKLRRAAEPRVPSWQPPKDWEASGWELAPGAEYAVVRLTKGKSGKRTEVPDYVTTSGYAGTIPSRTKVGDVTPEARLQLVDLATGEGQAIELPGGGGRAVHPESIVWSPSGRDLLVTAASDDDEDAWLLHVRPADGPEARVIHHVHDEAWVLRAPHPTFLGSGDRAFFTSEAGTGWLHVWIADLVSGEVRRLTDGRVEFHDIQAPADGSVLYAVATLTSPHFRDLVRIDPGSGGVTLLSREPGGRRIVLAPDGRNLAETFSTADRPWELRVMAAEPGAAAQRVTVSPSPAFEGYGRWERPEIVRIEASDGVPVPARLYRPPHPLPGHPAVLFVHGAGYLQNVHGWWSSYFREYGFHHLLRDAGYTVLDMDYRGSAGYGRDWRTAIHGRMGGRDLDDNVDGAAWLAGHEGCDPARIGIYGGSYGGFITLMALFTKPGVFAAGAALRPVTDWAHYNDDYTSNILDEPLTSPEHYERSSPIEFAEGLQDRLLILHGLRDTNVHAQDVFRLAQRLIELRKTGWEVASFPLEGHGFEDPASWADEYRRIRALFDEVLR